MQFSKCVAYGIPMCITWTYNRKRWKKKDFFLWLLNGEEREGNAGFPHHAKK
jgi:hypothetical protein